jgi:hypothetical protein
MLTTQRHDRRARRQARFLLESLDDRLVLSAGALGAAAEAVVHPPMANHAHRALHTGRREVLGHGSPAPMPANVSAALRSLYREYEDQDGSRFTPGQPGGRPLQISGNRVAVLIKVAFPPAFDTFLPHLRADGLKVIRTAPAYGLVEGMLPIAELPASGKVAVSVKPAPPLIMR